MGPDDWNAKDMVILITALGAVVTPIALGVIGYLSLRYKASASHVEELEQRILTLESDKGKCFEQVAALDKRLDDFRIREEKHQEDRAALASLLAQARIKLAATSAETKQVTQENTAALKENTEMTAKVVEALPKSTEPKPPEPPH